MNTQQMRLLLDSGASRTLKRLRIRPSRRATEGLILLATMATKRKLVVVLPGL